jgi:hypothetical protein
VPIAYDEKGAYREQKMGLTRAKIEGKGVYKGQNEDKRP